MKSWFKKVFGYNFTLLELFSWASVDYLMTHLGVKLGFLQEVNPIVNSYMGRVGIRIAVQLAVVGFLYWVLKKKKITHTTVNIIVWAEIFAFAFLCIMYVISGIVFMRYYV